MLVTISWLSGPEQRSQLGEGQEGWEIWCLGPWGQDQWGDLRAWTLGWRSEWKHGVSKKHAWQLRKEDNFRLRCKWTGSNGWRATTSVAAPWEMMLQMQLSCGCWCLEAHIQPTDWALSLPTSPASEVCILVYLLLLPSNFWDNFLLLPMTWLKSSQVPWLSFWGACSFTGGRWISGHSMQNIHRLWGLKLMIKGEVKSGFFNLGSIDIWAWLICDPTRLSYALKNV